MSSSEFEYPPVALSASFPGFGHALLPYFLFEKGFTEDDELWTPMDRETADQQQARARSALVEIFNGDNSTCEMLMSCSKKSMC